MTHFPPPAVAPGSATSQAAAAAVLPYVGTQRQQVYQFVAGHSLSTREQIADGLAMSQTSVCPRVTELLHAGLLRVFDDKGKTKNGCWAQRLMTSGKPYCEPPPPDTRQLTLPLSALSPTEQKTNLPPVSPSTALNDKNAAELARVEADRAAVAREREDFRRLEERHGHALDALNAEELAALVTQLPAKLQESLKLSPRSRILRFEMLKLLEKQSTAGDVKP